jgi:hypothetical protein
MSGYCKYCNLLVDEEEIIKVFDSNPRQLVWVGCRTCYKKRTELMQNATVKK